MAARGEGQGQKPVKSTAAVKSAGPAEPPKQADDSPVITQSDTPSIITDSTDKDVWFATQDLVLRTDDAAIELQSFRGRALSETALAQIKQAKQFEGLVAAGVLTQKQPQRINRNAGDNREKILQNISDVRKAA